MKHVVTLLALISLVICSLGVPLPMREKRDPSEEAYPCQNCGCGCPNAEACWRDCCCYTQAEKIAWAEANRVLPPAFVLAKLGRSSADSVSRSCCASAKKCCKSAKSCCSPTTNSPEGDMVDASIVVLRALKCRGLTSLLTSLPPSIVSSELEQLDLLPLTLGEVVFSNSLYLSPTLEIEPPPPQQRV